MVNSKRPILTIYDYFRLSFRESPSTYWQTFCPIPGIFVRRTGSPRWAEPTKRPGESTKRPWIVLMGKKKAAPSMSPAFSAADDDDLELMRQTMATEGTTKVVAQRNKDGWTPLHQAAFAGSVEVVQLLIDSGADVVSKCSDGDTPAHYASAQGHLEVVKRLVKKGGIRLFTLTDNDGESVLDVAQNPKFKRALEALEQQATNEEEEEIEDFDFDDEQDA
jgi:hypothetical protein